MDSTVKCFAALSCTEIVDGSTQWVIDPVVTWVELTHAADDETPGEGELANRRCQFVANRRPQFEAKPCQLATAAEVLSGVHKILKYFLYRSQV